MLIQVLVVGGDGDGERRKKEVEKEAIHLCAAQVGKSVVKDRRANSRVRISNYLSLSLAS